MGQVRLLAILAHPDDESLGFGGTLAKYAAEGVEVSLITATRGEAGRFHGHRPGEPEHPGASALGAIRAQELLDAGRALGIREVRLLDYRDAELDRANPYEATATLAHHVRDLRPDVVVTFGPDGAYGHPDHVAISQLASASVVAAASPHLSGQALPPHAASKLYYLAWPSAKWSAYEAAFRKLTVTVDQQERQATPWPDWAITTRVDTRAQWPTVWRAVQCHQSQIAAYERLQDLPQAHHEALWGQQSFYRAFSTVNGGRTAETDLFDGLRVTS